MTFESILSKEAQSDKMNSYMLQPPQHTNNDDHYCKGTNIAGLHCKTAKPTNIIINIETDLWKGEQSKAVENIPHLNPVGATQHGDSIEYTELQGESTREHKSCKSESMLLSRLQNYAPYSRSPQIPPRKLLFGQDTRNMNKDSV